MRHFAPALAIAASMWFCLGGASMAAPQVQSQPEKGTGDPDTQAEENRPKPYGCGTGTAGDPVEIATGALAFSKKVLDLPGRGRDVSFTLSYVSNAQGIETQTGARWTHDLEERIMIKYSWGIPPEPYPGPADAMVHYQEGGMLEGQELRPMTIDVYHFHDLRVDYYSRDPLDPTVWHPTSGQFTKLRSVNLQSGPYSYPQSFTLRHPNGIMVEFPNALWEGGCGVYTIRAGSVTDRQGNQIALNYEAIAKPSNCSNGEGTYFRRLDNVVDTLGRVVEFDYDTTGWLSEIRDHTGREVQIEHDPLGNITAITTPTVTVFPPDAAQEPYAARTEIEYSIPNPSFPHAQHNIARVFAPNEIVAGQSQPSDRKPYVENTWDPTCERVLSQVLGGTNTLGVPAGGVHAFLYSTHVPAMGCGWFECVYRTLSVSPDGHAELHHFDASWRPRLIYRFTAGLDPGAVASGNFTIDQLVSVDPSAPSTANQLQSGSGIVLPAVGSASPAIGCLWQRMDYTDSNLISLELTQDSRTEYQYDGASLDLFQQGNLLVLKRKSTATTGGDIIHAYAYEPLFNQLRLEYDPRAFGDYVPPNGGSYSPERYARKYFFDYQEYAEVNLPIDVAKWSIDLGQSSTATALLGVGLSLTPVAFGSDLNSNGQLDGAKGNIVREDKSVRVYLDPVATIPTFRTFTERSPTTFNGFGLPTTSTDPGGFKTFFTYYPASALAPQIGSASSATAGGWLASVSRAVDAASTNLVTEQFGYDAVGRQSAVRNGRGFTTVVAHDEADRVVLVTDPQGTDHGRLYDPNGNAIEELAEYSALGMNSATGLPTGTYSFPRFIRTKMKYDIMDNVVEREVQNGTSAPPSVVRYRYTKAGSRVLTLFPEWNNDPRNVEASVFDEFGRAWTVSMGGVTNQFATLFANAAIPGLGSLPVEVAEVTATRKSLYEGSRKVRDVGAEGNAIQYQHDGFNRVVRKTTPLGHYELYSYDSASQQTIVEAYDVGGARLSHVALKHDERGQVFEVGREHLTATGSMIGDGFATTRSAFDARGLCVKTVDDASKVSVTTFDGLGRSTRIDDPEGNYSVQSYDKNSNLIYAEVHEVESDAPANVHVRRSWSFHDSLDRTTASVDELGRAVRTRYDTLGRVIFTSDARAAAVNVTLASLDSTSSPQHGDLSSGPVVNAHGNTTWFCYDDAGYLLSTTRHMRIGGLGGNAILSGGSGAIVTSQTYDLNGRLTGEIDDKGNVTAYRHDSLNRRDRVTYANQTHWTAGYFKHGLLKWSTDPNGSLIQYSPDADGRPRWETVTRGAGVLGEVFAEFQHDALGRLTLARNAGATVTREYDTLSQLSAEVLNGKRTEVRSDGRGALLGFTYPGGRVLDHARDGIGRLKGIREAGASVDVSHLEYRGISTIKRRDYSNGTSTVYSHDSALRTLDVTHSLGGSTFSRRTSTWDRQGNRRTRQDPGQSPVRSFTFSYDSIARMTQSERTGGGQVAETVQYALDDVGNRVTVTGGVDAGAYTLNPSDAPLNLYSTTPSGANGYDANGNLGAQANATRALAYDYRDRLVEFQDVPNGRLHQFAYDALGRRIKKVTDVGAAQQKETRFFYAGGWSVIEERNDLDDVVATYVHEDALDSLIEMSRDPSGGGNFASAWVHSDDQLNVIAVTNAAGAVLEEYEYRDYGRVVAAGTMQPLTASAIDNKHLFNGRELDWETGLYNYRHRYLDPSSGRFVSKDPLGPWGDAANVGNAQAYCGNNPWSSTDPYGLNSTQVDDGDLSTGSTDPEGVKGDIATGSTDPDGVKGNCDHHGSAQATDKSGNRISSSQYWAARNAARREGQAIHDRCVTAIRRIIAKCGLNNQLRDSVRTWDITRLFGDDETDCKFKTSFGTNGEIVAHFTGNDGATHSVSFDCNSLSGLSKFDSYLKNLEGNIDASNQTLSRCDKAASVSKGVAVAGLCVTGAGLIGSLSARAIHAVGMATATVAPVGLVVGQRVFTISTHAAGRIASRFSGVTTQIENAITNGRTFNYLHEGTYKTGYYDAVSRVLVSTHQNVVLTVMDDVGPRYVQGLMKSLH